MADTKVLEEVGVNPEAIYLLCVGDFVSLALKLLGHCVNARLMLLDVIVPYLEAPLLPAVNFEALSTKLDVKSYKALLGYYLYRMYLGVGMAYSARASYFAPEIIGTDCASFIDIGAYTGDSIEGFLAYVKECGNAFDQPQGGHGEATGTLGSAKGEKASERNTKLKNKEVAIYGFEPNALFYKEASENLKGHKNIELINKVVAARSGTCTFNSSFALSEVGAEVGAGIESDFDSTKNASKSSAASKASLDTALNTEVLELESISLDEFVASKSSASDIKDIDLIKVYAMNSEVEVLKGAREILARGHSRFVLICASASIYKVLSFMTEFSSYRVVLRCNVNLPLGVNVYLLPE